MGNTQSKCVELVKKFNQVFAQDPIRFDNLIGVTDNWTPKKLIELYKYQNSPESSTKTDLSINLQMGRSSVTRKVSVIDWKAFEKNLEELCSLSEDEIEEKQVDQERCDILIKQTQKVQKRHLTNLAFMKHMTEKMVEAAKAFPRYKLKQFRFERHTKRTRTPEHMVLLLSDLHVGQEFSSKDTGNLNEYNLELLKTRVEKLRTGLVSIYEHHSELYDIPELHIFSLGDIVQGSNMGGEWGCAYNSNMDIQKQSEVASNYLCDLIATWSNCFKRISFTGVVGNHGRAGVAKNTDKVSANWDNAVYALLKAKMREHPNVNVEYNQCWWEMKDVNGTQFMLLHGDYIRGGINSLYSEEQRLQSLISQKVSRRFNYLCLGHFHNSLELETAAGGILVNGSFVGGDIHSMHQLRHISKPTQTVLGIHPRRGLTWKYKIDMSEKETSS